MNISPYSVSVFSDPCTECDVLAMIKRQESQKAQARKNARKQRARELTKARELEIKKANASPRLHPCGGIARLSAS
jgi:hypothetical protein